MYETLQYTTTESIARIAFSRPQHMNTFNDVMARELVDVTEKIKSDSNIRAVLLHGSGHLFMAGGDISFFLNQLDRMPDCVMDIVNQLKTSVMNLMYMQKPVLASVHGSVAGVGMSLMMACDVVLAAQETKFNLAYSGIGISPDGGASYHLPRIVGVKKAMELLMFSDVFDTQTALSLGLINWVTPQSSLILETEKILHRLSQGPTQSYAQIKKLVHQSWETPLESHLLHEGEGFAHCSTTQDFKTGIQAFLKKQKPEFLGK